MKNLARERRIPCILGRLFLAVKKLREHGFQRQVLFNAKSLYFCHLYRLFAYSLNLRGIKLFEVIFMKPTDKGASDAPVIATYNEKRIGKTLYRVTNIYKG
jgi:hypothetical protein